MVNATDCRSVSWGFDSLPRLRDRPRPFGRFATTDPSGFGLRRPKRAIRRLDLSGEVVAVGKPDSRFRVVVPVFGLGSGSFAEYVAADEREGTVKPPTVPFPEAATLGHEVAGKLVINVA